MDFAPALEFYEAALATGGDAGAKVGWYSGEGSQIANFIALCDAVGLADGVSVLDVGCGLGALLDYLARIGRRVDYVGVDISEKMVAAARELHPGATFEVRDILESPPQRRFDVVFCSGTLNYRIPDHHRWMGRMLARMYELANRAVAVNFLGTTVVPSLRAQLAARDEFAYVAPEDVVRFCRGLTSQIEIHHAWGSTFDVVLRRPREGTVAELARTLGVRDADSADARALIELAFRRRLYAELRDFLRGLPESATTLEWIARACAMLGENGEAIAAYERCAALSPARAEPCTSFGRLLLQLGRDIEARTWFREALSRAADNVDARYGLVLSLLQSGDRASARAAALETPSPVLRDLLDARTAEDAATALSAFERVLSAAPRCLDAIAGVAAYREEAGRWREAATLWERAASIAGDDPRVRDRLAAARARIR